MPRRAERQPRRTRGTGKGKKAAAAPAPLPARGGKRRAASRAVAEKENAAPPQDGSPPVPRLRPGHRNTEEGGDPVVLNADAALEWDQWSDESDDEIGRDEGGRTGQQAGCWSEDELPQVRAALLGPPGVAPPLRGRPLTERKDFIRRTRLLFCELPKRTRYVPIDASGFIDQRFFQPETDPRWLFKDNRWIPEYRQKLINAICKYGVGHWKKLHRSFSLTYGRYFSPEEVALQVAILLGSRNLRKYNGWKPTRAELQHERRRNRAVGKKHGRWISSTLDVRFGDSVELKRDADDPVFPVDDEESGDDLEGEELELWFKKYEGIGCYHEPTEEDVAVTSRRRTFCKGDLLPGCD